MENKFLKEKIHLLLLKVASIVSEFEEGISCIHLIGCFCVRKVCKGLYLSSAQFYELFSPQMKNEC